MVIILYHSKPNGLKSWYIVYKNSQNSIFVEFIGLLQAQQLHNYEFNMNLNDLQLKHAFVTSYSPSIILNSYLLTYLLHAAESFLRI
jgi:hypothetical protein